MDAFATRGLITTVDQLDALYDEPAWAARAKECDAIIAPYRAFIEAAPYVMMATAGPDGTDCSSRGGEPGFVRVLNEQTLHIPDYGGNNRIESLRNIVRDGRIALHFLIPGCGETLRVKGSAVVSAAPELIAGFAASGKAPKTVIVVTVAQAYYHCAKAVTRARLWDVTRQVHRETLPSVNAMLTAVQWHRCRSALTRAG